MRTKVVTVIGGVGALIAVLLLARTAWDSKMRAYKLEQELAATEAKTTNRFPDNLEFHVSFNYPTWKLQGLMPVKQESNRVSFISKRGDEVVFTQVQVLTNMMGTNVVEGTNENATAAP